MDSIEKLIYALPENIKKTILEYDQIESLLEIIMDIGRPLELRYEDSVLRDKKLIITKHDLDHFEKSIGAEYNAFNRAGVSGELHRISRILDETYNRVGLTIRIGKPINHYNPIEDLLSDNKNVLIVGPPGAGKTSLLRSCAKFCSEEEGLITIIVDESNEISGYGWPPHPCVGYSRRMSVPRDRFQHDVMIEAIENHMPDLLIVDEVSHFKDVEAARSAAQRGVMIIATCHGTGLESIIQSKPLDLLLGGTKDVTLGDQTAKQENTEKLVRRRTNPSAFQALVCLNSFTEIEVYHNIELSIDCMLKGNKISPEKRIFNPVKKEWTIAAKEQITWSNESGVTFEKRKPWKK